MDEYDTEAFHRLFTALLTQLLAIQGPRAP